MAVREYVGARYVPLFADEPWTNTIAYEPLTVVLHEGNSYTSRQYVPIGIDISNGEYWAETGNYNAQIEAYRKEVENIAKQLMVTQRSYDNVAAMVADVDIEPGQTVSTAGYYAPGDLGAALYEVVSQGTPQPGKVIALANGNYASLVVVGTITPEMFGAVGNQIADDTEALKACFSVGGEIVLTKRYKFSNVLEISNSKLKGIGGALVVMDTWPNYSEDTARAIKASGTVEIEGIEFSHLNPGAATGPSYFLSFSNSSDCSVHKCVFNSPYANSVSESLIEGYSQNKRLSITDCYINNLTNATSGGLFFREIVAGTCDGFEFAGNTVIHSSTDEALAVYGYKGGYQNVNVSNNVFKFVTTVTNGISFGGNDPTSVGGSTDAFIKHVKFLNNVCEYFNCTSKCIQIGMEATSKEVDDLKFSGNTVELKDGPSTCRVFSVYNATNCSITNNTVNSDSANLPRCIVGPSASICGNNITGSWGNVISYGVASGNYMNLTSSSHAFYNCSSVIGNTIISETGGSVFQHDASDYPMTVINNVVKSPIQQSIARVTSDGHHTLAGNSIDLGGTPGTSYLFSVGLVLDANTVISGNNARGIDGNHIIQGSAGTITVNNNNTIVVA